MSKNKKKTVLKFYQIFLGVITKKQEMIPCSIGAAVCGVTAYLLQKSAEGKSEEAVEMRCTSTTPMNVLYRNLYENGGNVVSSFCDR